MGFEQVINVIEFGKYVRESRVQSNVEDHIWLL